MKQVLLIATGGTIACRETENGLSPALTGEELLGLMPELNGICSVGVSDLMNLDSTDLTAADRAPARYGKTAAGTTALSSPTARIRLPIPPRCCTICCQTLTVRLC